MWQINTWPIRIVTAPLQLHSDHVFHLDRSCKTRYAIIALFVLYKPKFFATASQQHVGSSTPTRLSLQGLVGPLQGLLTESSSSCRVLRLHVNTPTTQSALVPTAEEPIYQYIHPLHPPIEIERSMPCSLRGCVCRLPDTVVPVLPRRENGDGAGPCQGDFSQ